MRSPKLTLTITAVAIIAAILLGGRINPTNDTTPTPNATAPPHTPTNKPTKPARATNTPSTAPTTPTREGADPDTQTTSVETPSHDGGEDPSWQPDQTTKQAAIDTAAAFINGWLQTDPDTRHTTLEPVTAQALLEALTTPGIKTWNTTPQGAPTIVRLAPTNAMIRQTFTDGRAVDILATAEPAAPNGWLITDIQPAT